MHTAHCGAPERDERRHSVTAEPRLKAEPLSRRPRPPVQARPEPIAHAPRNSGGGGGSLSRGDRNPSLLLWKKRNPLPSRKLEETHTRIGEKRRQLAVQSTEKCGLLGLEATPEFSGLRPNSGLQSRLKRCRERRKKRWAMNREPPESSRVLIATGLSRAAWNRDTPHACDGKGLERWHGAVGIANSPQTRVYAQAAM